MAKEKKLVQSITSRDEDFAQWYTGMSELSSERICNMGKYSVGS